MRATGNIRRIDDLGRLVVPKEVRRKLCIQEGDPFEIFYTEDAVTFKKYSPVKSVRHILDILNEAVDDEAHLRCHDELAKKIREMYELLNGQGRREGDCKEEIE